VVDEAAVDRAGDQPRAAGLEVAEPLYYPEYGSDYYAIFFEDPDGLRLEVMNSREKRRKIMYDWEARANL
jgi:glyoxylase I family protein